MSQNHEGIDQKQLDMHRRRYSAGQVFSPASPINAKDLFSGRIPQISTIIDAISQRGQHAVVYGERGVGKTSLVNVLAEFLQADTIIAPHINCDTADTYSSVWRKVFSRIDAIDHKKQIGLTGEVVKSVEPLVDRLPTTITTDIVRSILEALGKSTTLIIIIDEFDRLPSDHAKVFADTIKMLSDFAVPATLILVGVADTINDLMLEHQSIDRAIVQVQMPRMSTEELKSIVITCLKKINMEIEEDVLERMCAYSKGLPHYIHLLGLYSTWRCIESGCNKITTEHLKAAMEKALKNANQSIVSLYHQGTKSPHKDNLYSSVLLACALAKTDSLGYFAAADVREPLNQVTGKKYEIPSYARHLHDFCESARGPILQKAGEKYSIRFRFTNPLLQPYTILKGCEMGLLRCE